MVRNWLALTVEDQLVAHEGMGLAVGRCLRLFYADNSLVGSLDTEWLQGTLNVITSLLHRYGLVVNVSKFKAMACQTVTLLSGISEEAVGRRCTYRGAMYCERLRRRIHFLECIVELTVGLMTTHIRSMRGTEPEIYWKRLPVSQA